MPAVSVVIPTWNRAGLVLRAARSIVAQDYVGSIEIIIVDDGSTDDTLVRVREWIPFATGANRSVRLIEKSHSGIAPTMRRGFDEAHGEYVALLGSDDFWGPERVQLLMAEELRRGGDVVLYTDCTAIDADAGLQEPVYRFPDGPRTTWGGLGTGDILDFWHSHGAVAGGLFFLPRDVLSGACALPPDIPEEDFWLTLCALLRARLVYVRNAALFVTVWDADRVGAERAAMSLWNVEGQLRLNDLAMGLLESVPGSKRMMRFLSIQKTILQAKHARVDKHVFRSLGLALKAIAQSVLVPRAAPRAAATLMFVISPSMYVAVRNRAPSVASRL